MDAAFVRKERSLRFRKALAGLGVFSIILCCLLYVWRRRMTDLPTVVIPTPIMPIPNAYDTFVMAGAALKEGPKIDYALQTTVTKSNPLGRPFTEAERETIVQKNSAALALTRKGLGQSFLAPPRRSFTDSLDGLRTFRTLARLLRIEQHVRKQHGDAIGAVNSGLDAIHLGELIMHGTTLIGEIDGVACEATGRWAIWDEVNLLNAKETRTAAKALDHITSDHFPISSTIQEEEWAFEASLLKSFHRAGWLSELQSVTGADFSNVATKSQTMAFFLQDTNLVTYGKKAILSHYITMTDAFRARFRARYGLHLPLPMKPEDPYIGALFGSYSKANFKDVYTITENDLLLTSFALRAYYVEHGRYPKSLDALVPSYLAKLPQDEFAPSGTFQYRSSSHNYHLYSVGSDGIDDGGKPIDDPKNSNILYYGSHVVLQDSKGDIVAGINR